MEVSKILTADFLDIIFEGKNKDYGAYELRKTYNKRLSMSIAVMVGVSLLLVAGFMFGQDKQGRISQTVIIPPDVTLTDVDPPEEEPVIPPPPQKAPQPVMERAHVTIAIVPDEKVPDDQEIPENKDLEDARISLVNKDGPLFDNVVAPPLEEAAGRGIVAAPKQPNPDSVFMKVEIESKYPGGPAAWQRYLIKNLSREFPQELADQAISGKVVVQFIVDKTGNISNVRAISGPVELYETAVKVIKKSGKWEPASQNGQVVNSYKSQPIIFAIAEQ
ncbi:MAG: energy transducer TonB [Chitinophagaceae bacterium]|nr:MAG: energy transducer TonB [Chitinophagaceae bacterium]